MFAVGISIILAGALGFELYNYMNYKSMLSFMSKKKYHERDIDVEWIKDVMKNRIGKEDLENWIKNSISYRETDDNSYYKEVPLEKLSHKKILKWVAYYMFYKSLWQLTDDQLKEAEKMLNKIESILGRKFEGTEDDDIFFLKFGCNRIETTYKPLVFYGTLSLVKNYAYSYLKYYGFEQYQTPRSKITYFYFDGGHETTTLFIHGLGFGITPYLSFIMELSKTTNLIVPILPNISNMEFHSIFDTIEDNKLFPDYKHWRKDMISVFIKHNISKINGVGHSFGSIVLSIILKDKTINRFIDKRVFIDPVCFVYDSYKTFRYINQPDPRGGVVTKVFNELIYKDPYVRYTAQRFLHGPEFWLENYDNLKDNTLVILSWNDQLVASDSIYRQLKKHSIPCIVVNQAYHSEIFFNDEFEAVLQIITRFIELDHK